VVASMSQCSTLSYYVELNQLHDLDEIINELACLKTSVQTQGNTNRPIDSLSSTGKVNKIVLLFCCIEIAGET